MHQEKFDARAMLAKLNLSSLFGRFLPPPSDDESFARGYVEALNDMQPLIIELANECKRARTIARRLAIAAVAISIASTAVMFFSLF